MDVFIQNKNFRKFSIASILSSAGDILFYLAFMTYASKFKNYSLALSLIAISESLPKVLYSLGGYFADKTKSKINGLIKLAIARSILYFVVGVLFAQNIKGWNLILIVIAINFLSDLLGIYSSGLISPVIVDIVGQDEMAEATGFNSGINQIISTIAQFIGSGLLLFMSYSSLAVINAITFLIAGILFAIVGHQINKSSLCNDSAKINNRNFFKTIRYSIKQVKKENGLITNVLVLALLNGVLGSIEPLTSIVVAANRKSMILFNYTFTIAIIGSLLAIGASLGGIFGPKVLKKVPLISLSVVTAIVGALTIVGLISKNIFLCLPILCLLGLCVGTMAPKLTQWLVKSVDRTVLSSSIGLLNTILVIVAPIMVTILTTISAASTINYALYCDLAVCFLVLIVTVRVRIKK
ncbi:MFS transporter [Xylocopilactobacillus apicola]|uniref:Membrane protein n=1 Tax=Xylocopilactobacillus apicola TaxID=2932184 RepID=A0AAU9D5A6_9LACO|nr:MFS transporter [Xylocopilactobacillus apicola]BDR57656.1 membrane protein [Xylocopilactobacillus apicola]